MSSKDWSIDEVAAMIDKGRRQQENLKQEIEKAIELEDVDALGKLAWRMFELLEQVDEFASTELARRTAEKGYLENDEP